jgi:hypothetical protein
MEIKIWVWWYTPLIPPLGRLRMEDQEFEAVWPTYQDPD